MTPLTPLSAGMHPSDAHHRSPGPQGGQARHHASKPYMQNAKLLRNHRRLSGFDDVSAARHLLACPWHDTAWDGRVCANPRLNSSCLKLRRIAEGRNDAAEEKIKGQLLSDLPEKQWPCCIGF